jgi:hypothetical protein
MLIIVLFRITYSFKFCSFRWHAAVVIQRKFLRSTKRKDLIDSMHKAAQRILSNPVTMAKAKAIYNSRTAACTLIVQFLSATKSGMRSMVSSYLR